MSRCEPDQISAPARRRPAGRRGCRRRRARRPVPPPRTSRPRARGRSSSAALRPGRVMPPSSPHGADPSEEVEPLHRPLRTRDAGGRRPSVVFDRLGHHNGCDGLSRPWISASRDVLRSSAERRPGWAGRAPSPRPARAAASRSSPAGRSCSTRRSPRSRASGSGAAALAVAGDSAAAGRPRGGSSTARSSASAASTSSSTTPAARPPASFEDFDDDAWRAAWDLTLMSTLRLTRLALPELRKSGRGRVVNITSSAVKEPSEGLLLSNIVPARRDRLGEDAVPGRRARTASPSTPSRPGYIDTERMKNLYAGGRRPGRRPPPRRGR